VSSVPFGREREVRPFLVVGSVGGGKTQTVLHLISEAVVRGDGLLALDTRGDMIGGLPADGDPLLVAPHDRRSLLWDVAADCGIKQDARELAARFILRAAGSADTIKAAASEAGRSIDEDHYGASFAFHFGNRDATDVIRAIDAYAKRTGRDAGHAFAIGDADTIFARIAEYVDAGVSKFILRPLGGDDDTILAQIRQLIEQVLPRAEAR
jgi:alkanesulfonate monooxygenase SsuD/methylene tetrahydromethanopterin reductase-like flavin-dependent oxidoreductase (luciferase family)